MIKSLKTIETNDFIYVNNNTWWKSLTISYTLHDYVIVYDKPNCYRCMEYITKGYSKDYKIYCLECFLISYLIKKNAVKFLIDRECKIL